MGFFKRIMAIDRRIIYVIMAFAVIVPLIFPLGLPVTITPEVKNVYDKIERLNPGDVIMVALCYDPSTISEMQPMAYAVLRHCFAKNLKIIVSGSFLTGVVLMEQDTRKIAEECGYEYGRDYIYLGYNPYPAVVIMGMGENFRIPYPKDYYGTPLDDLEMMRGIQNYDDIKFVLNITATNSIDFWILYGHERYRVPLGLGIVAVSATNYYPYLQSGQIFGIIPGLKGASEYEKLISRRDSASVGMDIQSVAHMAILGFILLGNLGYFMTKKARKG